MWSLRQIGVGSAIDHHPGQRWGCLCRSAVFPVGPAGNGDVGRKEDRDDAASKETAASASETTASASQGDDSTRISDSLHYWKKRDKLVSFLNRHNRNGRDINFHM
ncbi:hypothetical protein L1987_16668 [Smallanthus sonchifolius]|uniref:Uncharacterized protein n=1 Tax=Smallanthus sonchifolius TaxID=185202 RepID=A0ACB9IX88_9ASTR|nr:hypothetical protein L1987_16668 [Smallanthus sonchifolius]